jgi:secondary thiamine-phosphate synthase enzyme
MEILSVRSSSHEELIDITDKVQAVVAGFGDIGGLCCVFTPHTTAAITINENADPSVVRDILKGLAHLGFESLRFSHNEGNSPSHLKSSIIGCSELICIEGGKLQLGTWQGIYFCEFDGPRSRKIYVQVMPSA